MNINIGDILMIETEVVDYNEKMGKIKIRIVGYQEDKRNFKESYIWVDDKDIRSIEPSI
jgi:hypothetical protein